MKTLVVRPWCHLWWQYGTRYRPHVGNTKKVWLQYIEGDNGIFKAVAHLDKNEKLREIKMRTSSARVELKRVFE